MQNENPNTDTGAIDGFYVNGGNPPRNTKDVVQSENKPLSDLGLMVAWPTVMTDSGGTGGSTRLAVSAARDDTLQAVNGTLLLHSGVAGRAGRISISGDENLIKALGFTEIQSASDSIYEVTVTDAHSGNQLASRVSVSGGTMYGILHENIDVRFVNNFAIGLDGQNLRDGGYGSYIFEKSGRNEFTVHIAASSVVLQIGANQSEDMSVSFGDTSAAALGVDKVSVRDRGLAARAVTIIDNAINKVSTKRARLGAYQNRLEHTISNLTAASANTRASESRIRDADMAKEMVDFTKLNILSQAGNSMLGQANQLPQNVLMLMR
jgi:flagellin